MLVTFSEFAIIKGCSRGAVTHATKGRIAAAVIEEDGKRWLDRDLALELWRKNTLKTHNAKIFDADSIEREQIADDSIPELNESRARREHYQAELAKLQVAQQRGELVPIEETKKEAYQIGRSIREALANLADRLCHQLAGETDAMLIHKMLSEEHRDALSALVEAKQ